MRPEDEDLNELSISLGELHLSIRTRRSATTPAQAGYAGPEPEAEEAPAQEPAAAAEDENAQQRALLRSTTVEEFLTFDIPVLRPLCRNLRSPDQRWTNRARIVRAYRAGLAARNRLDDAWGEGTPASPGIPFRNRYYIVLRGRGDGAAFWTTEGRLFLDRVQGPAGRAFADGVVCQSLPSLAEADAFLLGAGEPWPDQLQ